MHCMFGKGHGTLVLITDESGPDRFCIEYVQILQDGSIICGGGSSSWGKSEFIRPSTGRDVAAAKCYAARKSAELHEAEAKKARHQAAVWQFAVKALMEADATLAERAKVPQ